MRVKDLRTQNIDEKQFYRNEYTDEGKAMQPSHQYCMGGEEQEDTKEGIAVRCKVLVFLRRMEPLWT